MSKNYRLLTPFLDWGGGAASNYMANRWRCLISPFEEILPLDAGKDYTG
jgi:hypothetical protein